MSRLVDNAGRLIFRGAGPKRGTERGEELSGTGCCYCIRANVRVARRRTAVAELCHPGAETEKEEAAVADRAANQPQTPQQEGHRSLPGSARRDPDCSIIGVQSHQPQTF